METGQTIREFLTELLKTGDKELEQKVCCACAVVSFTKVEGHDNVHVVTRLYAGDDGMLTALMHASAELPFVGKVIDTKVN